MTERNTFFSVMADIQPDPERCERLALALSRVLKGHSTAEAVMAMCFHLNQLIRTIDDPEIRADVVAGLLRMIEPPEGNG